MLRVKIETRSRDLNGAKNNRAQKRKHKRSGLRETTGYSCKISKSAVKRFIHIMMLTTEITEIPRSFVQHLIYAKREEKNVVSDVCLCFFRGGRNFGTNRSLRTSPVKMFKAFYASAVKISKAFYEPSFT